MTTISKSLEINSPVSEVFTYFARPEHMADQFPENMGLNIIPIEVKNGFGVGTIFRISGDFDGKKLEWDWTKLRATNCPEADQFIQHHYRSGWKI